MKTLGRVALAWLTFVLLQGPALWACSVCYGAAESPIIKGAEMSILFMMLVTYTTLGGGIIGFLLLLRKRRKVLEQGS